MCPEFPGGMLPTSHKCPWCQEVEISGGGVEVVLPSGATVLMCSLCASCGDLEAALIWGHSVGNRVPTPFDSHQEVL